jgi:hypothetical protein
MLHKDTFEVCTHSMTETSMFDVACKHFAPSTNGDKIRQLSNTDLAEMLVYPVKPMNANGNIYYEFTSCLLLGKSYPMREQAVFLTERRLNAPADCVKQNGNHDTQADLCKVDNTESEGENELNFQR